MYKARVITISDRCYSNLRADEAGPAVRKILKEYSYEVSEVVVVPDEINIIVNELEKAVDDNINLVVTTGGTGFSKRDVTPEATKLVIEREAQGISEYMRFKSMELTPHGMLSRGVSGIKCNTLIINLPGSPKAASENLMFVINSLEHGLKMLLTEQNDCA
ncbi:MAG: MogA/MoaB family molybdenum cofactor biosynthesis protein [Ruminococcus sp.]|nr:MogA/MoaB family molybdenum cofactor biosynthesis protein [Ruminococcus sp.]